MNDLCKHGNDERQQIREKGIINKGIKEARKE
jgi:hypothetical protein